MSTSTLALRLAAWTTPSPARRNGVPRTCLILLTEPTTNSASIISATTWSFHSISECSAPIGTRSSTKWILCLSMKHEHAHHIGPGRQRERCGVQGVQCRRSASGPRAVGYRNTLVAEGERALASGDTADAGCDFIKRKWRAEEQASAQGTPGTRHEAS